MYGVFDHEVRGEGLVSANGEVKSALREGWRCQRIIREYRMSAMIDARVVR